MALVWKSDRLTNSYIESITFFFSEQLKSYILFNGNGLTIQEQDLQINEAGWWMKIYDNIIIIMELVGISILFLQKLPY